MGPFNCFAAEFVSKYPFSVMKCVGNFKSHSVKCQSQWQISIFIKFLALPSNASRGRSNIKCDWFLYNGTYAILQKLEEEVPTRNSAEQNDLYGWRQRPRKSRRQLRICSKISLCHCVVILTGNQCRITLRVFFASSSSFFSSSCFFHFLFPFSFCPIIRMILLRNENAYACRI